MIMASECHAAELEELVVVAEKRATDELALTGNVAVLGRDVVESVGHAHAHELMIKVPGVWVSRGSGQEHLTAIRSPVLTGAGSCGAFLTLEDGIATRPVGFCNVNQLFELYTEAAEAVEVIRGPANALYGSNALHGVINVRLPSPGQAASRYALELGANDYRRLRASVSRANWLADVSFTDDGGFRRDTGFEQLKFHGKVSGEFAGGTLIGAFSASRLDQETAGFIVGEDAYKDVALNRSNPNPEAFREADSQRLYAIWQRDFDAGYIDVRPFVRRSRMTFLQHFLPGQPLEQNGHESVGINAMLASTSTPLRWFLGVDAEWSDTFLVQTQDGPTEGSSFLTETRPPGLHYDFDVTALTFAPYLRAEWVFAERWMLSAGLRGETTRYRYDNNALVGNTRDDGTACGFGGCLYTRPADRRDTFESLAPKLGLRVSVSDSWSIFATARRGFRAPQTTELYRLQSGQAVSDLDIETIDALELGARLSTERVFLEVSAYSMRKVNSVLRDAEGFNVSAGQSRHTGIELAIDAQLGSRVTLDTNVSYGRHVYDFDLVAARGESFVSGNDVDTAPRWMAAAGLDIAASDSLRFDIDANYLGRYYVDAANLSRYPGHTLVNVGVHWQATPAMRLSLRVRNVADAVIADRADFAFGNFRYFPGRGRESFIELSFRPTG